MCKIETLRNVYKFLMFIFIHQYQCDQVSCEFMVNWMFETCSTDDREKT